VIEEPTQCCIEERKREHLNNHNRRGKLMDALRELEAFEAAGQQAWESYEQRRRDGKDAIRFVVLWR
jgi:hypothetical protein